MIVVCTGIPGVGKTTVMENVKALLEKKGMPCLIVNFGSVMFEVALQEKVVTDRDHLRKLPTETQRSIQSMAAQRISDIGKGRSIIVDTHCTIKTPEGFFPGLPSWVLDDLKPQAIVLVEAPDEEIYIRRLGDPTRTRDPDTIQDINTHQMLNRMYASSYSAYSGCNVKIIQNRQGLAEKAAQDFGQVMGVA